MQNNINESFTYINNDNSQPNPIKYAYFDLIIYILNFYPISITGEIFFITIELFQLLSFPFSNNFEYIWDNSFAYKLLNVLFEYSIITPIFKGNTYTYLFCFFFIIFFIFGIFAMLFIMIYKIKKASYIYMPCIKFVSLLIPMLTNVFYIPIINILLSIYKCVDGYNEYGYQYKCWTIPYIIFSCLGGLSLFCFIIFAHITKRLLYEIKMNNDFALGKRETYIELILLFGKSLLCITSKFITGYNAIRLLLFINWFVFIYIAHYLTIYPTLYRSWVIQKVYIILAYTTSWSLISLLIGAIFTKEKETIHNNLFVYVFIVGTVIIFIGVLFKEIKLNYYNLISPTAFGKTPKDIIEIIEELAYLILKKDKDRNSRIILNGFAHSNFDINSHDDIELLQYFEDPEEHKSGLICLLRKINLIYQYSIRKFPINVDLRIHYALFLYQYLSNTKQALIELTSATKINPPLSKQFIIYHLKKKIEGTSNEIEMFTKLSYKGMKEKLISLMIKVSLLYVKFWSTLSITDNESQRELGKLNDIGTKINDIVEEIHKMFDKMQKIHPNDIEVITSYTDFCDEILNDKKTASKYKTQIIEMGIQSKIIIEDANISHLDLNLVCQNDKYQCVIYSAMEHNIGIITHISLSLCGILGYTKNEIIGKPIESIIPEIFAKPHHKRLISIKDEYNKQHFSNDNNLEINFKEINFYFRSKARYLIPLKVKFAIFQNESNQYFIMRILQEEKSYEQFLCFVLTNQHLFIENVSSNAIVLLNLHLHNKVVEITNYIKQFNEEFLRISIDIENESDDSDEMNMIEKKRKIKHELIQKYITPTPITWLIVDNVNSERKKLEDNFILTIQEIFLFGGFQGYLFKFEALWSYNIRNQQSYISNKNLRVNNIQGQNINKDYIPQYETGFVIDAKRNVFIKEEKKEEIDKMRNDIKLKAQIKITQKKNTLTHSQLSNEESSYTYSDDSYETNSNANTKTKSNIDNEIEYYQVNLDKIKLYVYDYKKRIFIEDINKEKRSAVDEKLYHNMNSSIKVNNTEITSQNEKKKSQKEFKPQNSTNKKIIKEVTEDEILKTQIELSLKTNSVSFSISILHLTSILALFVLIMKSIVFSLLMLNRINTLSSLTFMLEGTYDQLINTLMALYHTRELTLLNIPSYSNITTRRNLAYSNYTSTIKDLFMKVATTNTELIFNKVQLTDNETSYLDSLAGKSFLLNDDLSVRNISDGYRTVISNVNFALFHIANTSLNDLYTTNKDVFFFIYNTLNSVYIGQVSRIELIIEMCDKMFNKEGINFVIIFICTELLIGISYWLVRIGLKKVSKKKNSYITVFFAIDKKIIMHSLSKCEHFSIQYQNKNKNPSDETSSNISSLSDESELLYENTPKVNIKNTKSRKAKNYSNDILTANRYLILILCIIFINDLITTTLNVINNKLIRNGIEIYHSENIIQKYSIIIFNLIREYMFDYKSVFQFEYIEDILPSVFKTLYLILQTEKTTIQNKIDKLPIFFYNNYYRINSQSICSYGEYEFNLIFGETNKSCDEFTNGAATLGLDKLLMLFLEEIRTLKGLVFDAKTQQEQYGFEYNYTLYGTKYFNEYLPKDQSQLELYYSLGPITLFNSLTHTKLSFYFSFLIKPAFNDMISLLEEGIMNIINEIKYDIYFCTYFTIGVLVILYFVGWITFIKKLNVSIYKTKNMLSIIPIDTLSSVWNIKQLLDIDIDSHHNTINQIINKKDSFNSK